MFTNHSMRRIFLRFQDKLKPKSFSKLQYNTQAGLGVQMNSRKLLGLGLAGGLTTFVGFSTYSSVTTKVALAMTKKELSDSDSNSTTEKETNSFTAQDFKMAVDNNDIARVRRYIDDEDFDLSVNNCDALNLAVTRHNNQIAREIIESKRVSTYYIKGDLCKLALSSGNIDIAQKIIGNPNTRPERMSYRNLITAAAESNEIKVLEYAVDSLFAEPNDLIGALSVAASKGNLGMMQYIFEQGAPTTNFSAANAAIVANQLNAFILLMGRADEQDMTSIGFPLKLILHTIIEHDRSDMLKVFYKFNAAQAYGKEYCDIIFSFKDLPLGIFKSLVELNKMAPNMGLTTAVNSNYSKLEYILGLDCITSKDLEFAAEDCINARVRADTRYIAPMSYTKLLASDKILFAEIPQMQLDSFEHLEPDLIEVSKENIRNAIKVHADNNEALVYLKSIETHLAKIEQNPVKKMSLKI